MSVPSGSSSTQKRAAAETSRGRRTWRERAWRGQGVRRTVVVPWRSRSEVPQAVTTRRPWTPASRRSGEDWSEPGLRSTRRSRPVRVKRNGVWGSSARRHHPQAGLEVHLVRSVVVREDAQPVEPGRKPGGQAHAPPARVDPVHTQGRGDRARADVAQARPQAPGGRGEEDEHRPPRAGRSATVEGERIDEVGDPACDLGARRPEAERARPRRGGDADPIGEDVGGLPRIGCRGAGGGCGDERDDEGGEERTFTAGCSRACAAGRAGAWSAASRAR
jgi:hypothetical protein